MNNLKSNMSEHLYLTTFILGFSVLSFQACVNPPDYPIEPVLTFKSLSKNEMKQGLPRNDSIEAVLGFTDGDGDLGNAKDGEDTYAIIFDPRDNVEVQPFKVPYVAPQGKGKGINGEMTLRIYRTCCKYPDGSEPCLPSATYKMDTLHYKVWIFDRAGHKSNELELPAIFLDCTK